MICVIPAGKPYIGGQERNVGGKYELCLMKDFYRKPFVKRLSGRHLYSSPKLYLGIPF